MDKALTAALHRLLRRLRRYIEVVPTMEDDRMPEHDVVWVSYDALANGCPEELILQAIREEPALWLQAVPVECCIIPRAVLEKAVSGPVAEALLSYGEAAIFNHAARKRAEREDREERCRG